MRNQSGQRGLYMGIERAGPEAGDGDEHGNDEDGNSKYHDKPRLAGACTAR